MKEPSENLLATQACEARCGQVVCTQRQQRHVQTKAVEAQEIDRRIDTMLRSLTHRHQPGLIEDLLAKWWAQ